MLTATRNLILLVALVLMAFPALAQDACDAAKHQETACCGADDCICPEPTDQSQEESSSTDDCCATGCDDCGLPCCGATATLLSSKPDLGSRDCALAKSPPLASDLSLVDLDPLYHPPRA